MNNKTAARFREQNILNIRYGNYFSANKYGIPEMLPAHDIDLDAPLQSFNYARSGKDTNCGIHFFLHDYQFERVWNNPSAYIQMLKRFKFVLTPDFSPYNDMPRALQVYNVYRNRWCGRYWQENGIKAIPTVTWSDDDTLDFCLCGVPKHSIIAISTMGEGRWANYRSLRENWDRVIEALEPEQVLLYGKDLSAELGGCKIVHKGVTSLQGIQKRKTEKERSVVVYGKRF